MLDFNFDFDPSLVFTSHVPAGYRGFVRQAVIGSEMRFESAVSDVLAWQVQRRSGLRVQDVLGQDAPPARKGLEGRVVLPMLHVGVAGVNIEAPFRVTEVVTREDVAGFAYGTLPGHPERGVEAFLVRRGAHETYVEIRAISKPAMPYALLPQVGRALQARYTVRYLNALL